MTLKKIVVKFVVSTVPADGLAPNGARPSAGAVMTKFRSHMYKGLKGLNSCPHTSALVHWFFNTLTHRECSRQFNCVVIFTHISLTDIFSSTSLIVTVTAEGFYWWPVKDIISWLVQVMAWCHQATCHYLCAWGASSVTPYCISRPQWVNDLIMAWCPFSVEPSPKPV